MMFLTHVLQIVIIWLTDLNLVEKPYKIQEDLMKAIYTAIEDRKIGIFESPTGTGKSKLQLVSVAPAASNYVTKLYTFHRCFPNPGQ